MRIGSTRRVLVAALAVAVLAASCSDEPRAASDPQPTESVVDVNQEESRPTQNEPIEDYPDAQTRALAARARERRPVENSALPPRHLDPERHPEILVERTRIVSGGPPPDGIPSIDSPAFLPVDEVDFLEDEEPVAVLKRGDETRIYPIRVMIWHEIVNDEVNGEPLTVTYCPLCNSVVAYQRTVGDVVLDFGTSGALYQSALVMYDRQTESLWTHFDGLAVTGTMIGTRLELVPAALVSWRDARADGADGLVLTGDAGGDDRPPGGADADPDDRLRPYGRVPYPNYEAAPPSAGYVTGEVDPRLPAKQRVTGVGVGAERVAIDRRRLEDERVLAFDLAGEGHVVMWSPGTSSALDGREIADGVDVGAVGVFRAEMDGRAMTFSVDGDEITDDRTGSTWSVLGRAVDGPLAGATLEPVVHLDTFWFSWVRYHPGTSVID